MSSVDFYCLSAASVTGCVPAGGIADPDKVEGSRGNTARKKLRVNAVFSAAGSGEGGGGHTYDHRRYEGWEKALPAILLASLIHLYSPTACD